MIYFLSPYLILNSFVMGYMYRDQFRNKKDFTTIAQLIILGLFGSIIMAYAIIKTKGDKKNLVDFTNK